MKFEFVRVRFGTSIKYYDYINPRLDLQRGDYVIVDSSNGFGLAKVMEVDVPKKEGINYAWILTKFDANKALRALQSLKTIYYEQEN